MDKQRTLQHFCELVLKFRDGQMGDEELLQFQSALRASPEARQFYIDAVVMHAIFEGRKSPLIEDNIRSDEAWDQKMWNAMAAYESTAETIPIDRRQPGQDDFLQDTKVVSVRRPPNKTQLFAVLTSIAALFLVIVFLKCMPQETRVKVAILSDSINAVWANTGKSIEKDDALVTSSEPLILREGYAQLLFDNRAQMTIKAPAELQLLSGDVVKLNYGEIYSVVPPQAYGFQVCTRDSKIIDLGTEFGVKQDVDGDVEVHMLKGKAAFVSKAMGKNVTLNLFAGTAQKLDAATGEIKGIPCNEYLFIRQINSKTNTLWHGQPLNLADMVGGGNGFGTGQLNMGIEYTGNMAMLSTVGAQTGPAHYIPAQSNPFVDGVFIPNGNTQIDSAGTRFEDFESTDNNYWLGVLNGSWHHVPLKKKVPRHQLRLHGIEYGTDEHPAIYIHANQGVTFDLRAITRYTQMEIGRFTAICGISESYRDYNTDIRTETLPKASFYVLVDGHAKFVHKDVTCLDVPVAISIDLGPQDRFLTIATTQASSSTNDGDWTLFAEPYLQCKIQ